jgi:hypothetical protein
LEGDVKRIFQTTFGVPTGNCFNAAVASILDLSEIPPIDPAQPNGDERWRGDWCDFFDRIRVRWSGVTWEPEFSNWEHHPKGLAIACVELRPGVLHAVVCLDGVPIHDVYPGSTFCALPDAEQRKFPILAWNSFSPLAEGEVNNREELGALPAGVRHG